MTTLAGNVVLFRLSPEGEAALSEDFPGGRFEARVLYEDELGVWVPANAEDRRNQNPRDVMLLKWHYFSTAVVEFRPEPPERAMRPGFIR